MGWEFMYGAFTALCMVIAWEGRLPIRRGWKNLTDEEMRNALKERNIDDWFSYRLTANIIQEKLREKNNGSL